MKINSDILNQVDVNAGSSIQPIYKKDEVSTGKMEDKSQYGNGQEAYARKQGFDVSAGVFAAMIARAKKVKTVSIREADIACRGNLDLNHKSILYWIMEAQGLIDEGPVINSPLTVYELRRYYNRGIQWMKDTGSKMDQGSEKVRVAKDKMQEILNNLAKKNLPAFKNEIIYGFEPSLLQPEYMDHAQYSKAVQRRVVNGS